LLEVEVEGVGMSPGISLGMWCVFVAAVVPERVFRWVFMLVPWAEE
jgi:hypothetical protein